MAENFLSGNQAIEAEIAQLQQMIEVKRNQLESQSGIVEEKELVRSALKEMIGLGEPQAAPASSVSNGQAISQTTSTISGSYLDRLDEEGVATVNRYIEGIGQQGLVKTLNKVAAESPFVVDAVHDVLVDKLYEQLKAKNLIK